MGFLLSVCRIFSEQILLRAMFTGLLLTDSGIFEKPERISLEQCLSPFFVSIFIEQVLFVYQPRLMQTRVLFDLLKIANFCVEYQ